MSGNNPEQVRVSQRSNAGIPAPVFSPSAPCQKSKKRKQNADPTGPVPPRKKEKLAPAAVQVSIMKEAKKETECNLTFEELERANAPGPLLTADWTCRKCTRIVADHAKASKPATIPSVVGVDSANVVAKSSDKVPKASSDKVPKPSSDKAAPFNWITNDCNLEITTELFKAAAIYKPYEFFKIGGKVTFQIQKEAWAKIATSVREAFGDKPDVAGLSDNAIASRADRFSALRAKEVKKQLKSSGAEPEDSELDVLVDAFLAAQQACQDAKAVVKSARECEKSKKDQLYQQLECAGSVARAAASGSSLAIDDVDDLPEAPLPLPKGLNREEEEEQTLDLFEDETKEFQTKPKPPKPAAKKRKSLDPVISELTGILKARIAAEEVERRVRVEEKQKKQIAKESKDDAVLTSLLQMNQVMAMLLQKNMNNHS